MTHSNILFIFDSINRNNEVHNDKPQRAGLKKETPSNLSLAINFKKSTLCLFYRKSVDPQKRLKVNILNINSVYGRTRRDYRK